MRRREQLEKMLFEAYREGYPLNSQYNVKISQELDKHVVDKMKRKMEYQVPVSLPV